MAGSELTFAINSYNRPDVKENADADALRIIRAILKRRDNPLLGQLNFNISRFRFEDMENLETTLENDILTYIKRVAPDIIIDDLKVQKLNDTTLGIGISIHGVTENSVKKYLIQLEKPAGIKNVQLKDIINI